MMGLRAYGNKALKKLTNKSSSTSTIHGGICAATKPNGSLAKRPELISQKLNSDISTIRTTKIFKEKVTTRQQSIFKQLT